MIFKDSTQYDSYHFPFNWGAEYYDSTYLTEFDLDTNEKNDFYSISQNKVSRFGLFGCGLKLYYNNDGSFNLAGQRIEIEYHIDDKIFPLTTSFEKKDCITYKQKEMWYQKDLQLQSAHLVSIDFGYKTLINYDGIQFFFQPIVKAILPNHQEDGRVEIEIKMTSNMDMQGDLIIKNKGCIVEKVECPLLRNHSSTFNWRVQ